MNLIKLYKILLFSYLKFWTSSSKFETCINSVSLLITIFSTSLIIIIISVNEGFKDNITQVLNDLNGSYRIYNDENDLNKFDYEFLKKKLPDTRLSAVSEVNCMIKFNNKTEGVVLNSTSNYLDNNGVNRFITCGYYSDSTIVIGEMLKDNLNLNINDNVFLLNFENNKFDEINKIKVSGFFKTNIPDYDEHIIFTGLSNRTIINSNSEYSYFRIDSQIDSNFFLNSEYTLYNAFELNRSFHLWLSTYDNPIKVLILFLFIISLLNIINNNYYLVYYKKEQIKILSILGLDKKDLKYILILRSVLLSSFSAILGLLIAYSLLLIESTMHFVKLPSHVYFINSLPISIQYNFILIILAYIAAISFFSSFLNFNTHKIK